MRVLTIIAIILSCLIFAANSQKIELKILEKEKAESEFKITEIISCQDTVKVFEGIRKIYLEYLNGGYLAVSVDSVYRDSSCFYAGFIRGSKYIWGEISISGTKGEIMRTIDNASESIEGKTVKIEEFNELIANILNYYENNGYPFVMTYLDSVEFSGDTIKGVLKIEENNAYKIDSLIVKGSNKISSSFMKKYLGIGEGSFYNESKIKSADRKINELSYAKSVKPVEILFKEKDASLLIYTENKKANRFNGILGVVPNDKVSDKLLLTGNLNLFLINSFKAGESILFDWQKPQSLSQNLEAGFTIPYIYKSLGIDNSFELQKKDTSFLNVRFNLGVMYSFNGLNYTKVFYEHKSSVILSDEGFEYITVLPDFSDTRTDLYGFSISYEDYDYKYNPSMGYSVYFMVATGKKQITENPKINPELYSDIELISNQLESKFSADVYIPVASSLTIKFNNHSGYLYNEHLFENEMYQIGGMRFLRGFDEKSIFASTYSVFCAEPRFIFEQNSSLFTFIDYGFYEKRLSEYHRDNPMGLGIGLDFDSGAGIFTIIYAIGRQAGNPFDFQAAKIHFGYLNRF